MSEDDKNDIERRKFPTIAIGITALVIGLLVVLAIAKYTTPKESVRNFEAGVQVAALGGEN